MVHHIKKLNGAGYRSLAFFAVALFLAIYLFLSGLSAQKPMLVSAEAAFSDTSASGLAVVPASGGTVTGYYQDYYQPYYQPYYEGYYQPYYQGAYPPQTGSYPPTTGTYDTEGDPTTGSYPTTGTYTGGTGSYGPGGSTGSYAPGTGSYTSCWDGSTPVGGSCPPCPEGYTQVGNACVPPGEPGFEGFTTPGGFRASGHLEVRPTLVRSGDTTRVYWNVRNVRDCTVRGTNGDGAPGSITGTWNQMTSGATGVVTGPITSRTEYTLFCRALVGATPSTITETRTVNVIPQWYEPSEGN